ncbi:ribosome 60S biogenesis N-terminal-domain-containing protein [Gloeopeniophorella convolvens]|nr:ribosome 60S biogenesis N-terminal-domain-containing protein [Gloeopeniophorella convolvens]
MAPAKLSQRDGPPRKRAKLDASSRSAYRYTDGADIERGLQAQTQDVLIEALTALRNQLTIKSNEGPVQPQDERLALVQSWMEVAPGAQSIFAIWEGANQRQHPLLAQLVSVLASLVTLLSTHYTHHKLGHPILKTLLSSEYIFHLNTYLTGSHNELILWTLKLFNAMSSFAGGSEKRAILEGFAWEAKGLHKLLSMRRRTKASGSPDILSVPDIRTLYILLILSFVDNSSTSSVKSSFLEQRQDIFRSILTGLEQDSYLLVRRVLEVSWMGIWSDPKVRRTLKVGLFNETALQHITKLYSRSVSEDSEEEQVPADLVHHFLLAICTHPGVGVCFKDRGWYPRETEDDAKPAQSENDEVAPRNTRIYNKILAQLLRTLKVNEDPRQQELALRILTSCPELVSGYWSAVSLTLEPRLSSKWIANIAFFGNIISLPVPEASFLLPEGSLYQPTPPPLAAFLENVFPSVNTKAHFSRGLMSTFPLVQHCTAQALAKCLTKYSEVLKVMQKAGNVLEEDEDCGQWKKRRSDLEREARRRVPDFQVIIALSQKVNDPTPPTTKEENAQPVPVDEVRTAMLAESLTRLLWLYHLCFPLLVAEARFDVGKLLLNSFEETGQDDAANRTLGLDTLRRLHVLRLLKESDQFLWWSGSRSYISILLNTYATTDVLAIRNAIEALLRHVLSGSILFEHDPEEVYLWLSSLPIIVRTSDAETPDGTPLSSEQTAVIGFLDDCIQRCLKTPYRYIEDLELPSGSSDTSGQDGVHTLSPLLATVMEQLSAKHAAGLLAPSDTLAVTSFVRRLLVRLSGKQGNLLLLGRLLEKLSSLDFGEESAGKPTIIGQAIKQEIRALGNYLHLLDDPTQSLMTKGTTTSAVVAFLDRVENTLIPSSKVERQSSAFELIDFVRLIDSSLDREAVTRLISVVARIHPTVVEVLLEYLDPARELLKDAQFFALLQKLQPRVPFTWAFIQCGVEQLSSGEYRDLLTSAISDKSYPLLEAKAALNVLAHRMSHLKSTSSVDLGVLMLIADIMRRSRGALRADDFAALKAHLFAMPSVKVLFTSSAVDVAVVEQGLRPILDASVDPSNLADHRLLLPFSSHWALVSSSSSRLANLPQIVLWAPYMTPDELLSILDHALQDSSATENGAGVKDVIQSTFSAIERYIATNGEVPGLRQRLPQLVTLYSAQPDWALLETLIAKEIESALPSCIDGLNVGIPSDLAALVSVSSSRWSKRSVLHLEGLDVSVFLQRPTWTSQTVSIIKTLVYSSQTARQTFRIFLESKAAQIQPATHLAPAIWSWLDADPTDDLGTGNVWKKHFNKLATGIVDTKAPMHHRFTCSRTMQELLRKLPSLHLELASDMQDVIKALPADTLTVEVLQLGEHVIRTLPQADSDDLSSTLLDHGIRWASRAFADADAVDDGIVKALGSLLKRSPNVKPHLTDTVLTALIQNRLSESSVLDFASDLVATASLKPLLVNRHLQSIVQHTDFYKYTETTAVSRDALVRFVHILFLQHPTNTCQPSHVLPLAPIYRGTLSASDRRLLSIFRLFEEAKKTSAASLLTRSVSGAEDALDAMLNLDANAVFRACTAFPSWRKMDDLEHQLDIAHPSDEKTYDPVFIALLTAHMMAGQRPSSALQWVQLFRTNVVSLLIRSLSSSNDQLRDICIAQISSIMNALQHADLQEKPHALYILHLLKDAHSDVPADGPTPRLPAFATLLLAHALRGVFHPAHFLYPLTARFLLQRPTLDLSDVPLLYGMLYSAADGWRRERSWLLRFLADAMRAARTDEWRVFRRRHTWDLLASLWLGAAHDRALRAEILEVLCALTARPRIAAALVRRAGLLAWAEAALRAPPAPRADEQRAWLGVLAHVLAAGGADPAALARCLCLLRAEPGAPEFKEALRDKARVVVGLALRQDTAGVPPRVMRALLAQCVEDLRHLEGAIGADTEARGVWGEVVVGLWRATMASDVLREAWEALTPRVLVWSALAGGADEVAEWARREVVRSVVQ